MAPSMEPNHIAGGEENETYSFATQLLMGTVVPMAVQTAFKLGVFEIIARAGPGAKLSAADIAAQMPTKNKEAPVMVDRIARLLASHNVLACSVVDSLRLYSLLPVSYYFVPDQDGVSFGPVMELIQGKIFLDSWSQLKDSILEGGIAFNRVHGMNAFEYGGLDAKFNQVFNTSMFNVNTTYMRKIIECYKGFQGIKRLVDVGGNQGLSLRYITSKYPNIKGINFDLPHVIHHAPSYPGVDHVAGDMFESVPEGDAIFMKFILHDWSDEHCVRLLKNCYKAIPDNGKVIIADSIIPVMPEATAATKATFQLDVLMMTQHLGGKERTRQEFMGLAKEAGFNRVEFVQGFYCNFWIIEFYKN